MSAANTNIRKCEWCALRWGKPLMMWCTSSHTSPWAGESCTHALLVVCSTTYELSLVYYNNNAFSNIICCCRYTNGKSARMSLFLSGWRLVDFVYSNSIVVLYMYLHLENLAFLHRFKKNIAYTGLFRIFLIIRLVSESAFPWSRCSVYCDIWTTSSASLGC
jgi:hypothetical protein